MFKDKIIFGTILDGHAKTNYFGYFAVIVYNIFIYKRQIFRSECYEKINRFGMHIKNINVCINDFVDMEIYRDINIFF